MTPGKVHYKRHFGFRHFKAEDTNNRQPLLVDSQHDIEGLRMVQSEEPLQDMDDKLHRRIVVVQQQHLVHWRPLRFCFCLGQNRIVRPRTIRPAGQGCGVDGQEGHAPATGIRFISGIRKV